MRNSRTRDNQSRTLHPTKGWRKTNVKRSRAGIVVQNIMSGENYSLSDMKAILLGT